MSAFSVNVDSLNREALFDLSVQEARGLEGLHGNLSDVSRETQADPLVESLQQFKQESVHLPDMPDIVPLTPDALMKQGLSSDYIQAQSQHFAFYSLSLPLTLFPRQGYVFDRVECQLNFSDGRPPSERPLAHSIFPTSEYHTLATANLSLDVGLNDKLEFAASTKDISAFKDISALSGKANVSAGGGVGFKFPLREYHVKLAEVVASGAGSSEVFWRLSNQTYINEDQPKLSVILKIPLTAAPPIHASGVLVAYRSFSLWSAAIGDALRFFSDSVRNWFKSGAPVVAHAEWNLSGLLK